MPQKFGNLEDLDKAGRYGIRYKLYEVSVYRHGPKNKKEEQKGLIWASVSQNAPPQNNILVRCFLNKKV